MGGKTLKLAILGGGCYAVHFGAWVSSLTMTTVASSVTLVTATPLMLALVGWFTGKDKPSARLWIAIGVACVGLAVGLLCQDSGRGPVYGSITYRTGLTAARPHPTPCLPANCRNARYRLGVPKAFAALILHR